MHASNIVGSEAIQRIKDVVYDLQIGPTEITPAAKAGAAYSVRFDNHAGNPEEVFILSSCTYWDIHTALKSAYARTPG